MGVQARELVAGDLESQWWETRISRFRDYFRLWERYGFIRMFRSMLARESIKERLLRFSDGERRLTNVMHLAELLHRQSIHNNTGMTVLLKWLAEQRDPSSPRLEEDQLRLESDEQAVKIVTIHKSKGLEYPVVFCPFAWEDSLVKSREFAFHDIDNDLRLTIDMGSEVRSRNITLAQNELLSENLRLLYVALTRAKQKCYLAWGRINTAETSAPAYLLHGDNDERSAASADDCTRLLKKNFDAKTNADLREDLNRLAARSQKSINVMQIPGPGEPAAELTQDRQIGERLFCREFSGKIDHSWKISSYSALVSTGSQDADQPDRDTSLSRPEQGSAGVSEDPEAVEEYDDTTIFSFPGGARAGIFFHDLFEHLDFTDGDSKRLEHLVENKLPQYGFDLKWKKTICRTVNNVLSTPLLPHSREFRLSSIGTGDKISEMEFHFPLNTVVPKSFKKLFEQLNRSKIDKHFPLQLEKLSFAPSSGFMKGYIDLAFHYQGRFYLVDWKSNHLGSNLDNYTQSSLNQTMAAEYYYLQYHIYVLALHQHLRIHQPDYRYENNFGGVFYIFIRGVHDAPGQQYGIFFDLPDPQTINDFGKTLIPGYII
jgi:exodeoxyribonuclease V beta subunit